MLVYIVRRLLISIPVVVLASVVVFFGVSAVGDPLGELRATPGVSQETIQNVVERRHLDQPLPREPEVFVDLDEPVGGTQTCLLDSQTVHVGGQSDGHQQFVGRQLRSSLEHERHRLASGLRALGPGTGVHRDALCLEHGGQDGAGFGFLPRQ